MGNVSLRADGLREINQSFRCTTAEWQNQSTCPPQLRRIESSNPKRSDVIRCRCKVTSRLRFSLDRSFFFSSRSGQMRLRHVASRGESFESALENEFARREKTHANSLHVVASGRTRTALRRTEVRFGSGASGHFRSHRPVAHANQDLVSKSTLQIEENEHFATYNIRVPTVDLNWSNCSAKRRSKAR